MIEGEGITTRKILAGETLDFQNNGDGGLIILTKGRVRINMTSPLGRIASLVVSSPISLCGHKKAIALDDSELLTIRGDLLESAMKGNPKLYMEVIFPAISRELRYFQETFFRFSFDRAPSRLLYALRTHLIPGTNTTEPVTQDLLAAEGACTLTTTIKALRKLKEEGKIKSKRFRGGSRYILPILPIPTSA